MLFPTRSRYAAVFLVLILVLALPVVAGSSAQNVTARASEDKVTIASYELIGTTSVPTGTQFEGTVIGGLSSIAYDSRRAGGGRKIDTWFSQVSVAVADFGDEPDTFVNVNDPDERQKVEARLLSTAGSR